MSDDEVHSDEDERSSSSEEEEEEEDVQEEKKATEAAELIVKKRAESEKHKSAGLDETSRELLEQNREERDKMDAEIRELRRRNESRKKQREVEEKRLTAERAAEEARRKADEENRRRLKEEEELRKQRDRARKMAEFETWKNPPKANFVISKRTTAEDGQDEDAEQKADEKGKKSKERLEEEKRAILKQRIRPLDIDDADAARLADKAKELLNLITRLESEKYDLEKNYKARQMEMMELAERARQANRVGKEGLKRIQLGPDTSVDRIQERFAGAPSKVEMYSKYERQKDKRSYDDRLHLFTGPQFVSPPDRIRPQKLIRWNDEGLPVYDDAPSGGDHADNSVPVDVDVA